MLREWLMKKSVTEKWDYCCDCTWSWSSEAFRTGLWEKFGKVWRYRLKNSWMLLAEVDVRFWLKLRKPECWLIEIYTVNARLRRFQLGSRLEVRHVIFWKKRKMFKLCSCPQTLQETEIKGNGIIDLAVKICVQTFIPLHRCYWLLFDIAIEKTLDQKSEAFCIRTRGKIPWQHPKN